MFELLVLLLLFGVGGKLIGATFKLTWAVTKVLFFLFFLPLILFTVILGGIIKLAMPILIVLFILYLIRRAEENRY